MARDDANLTVHFSHSLVVMLCGDCLSSQVSWFRVTFIPHLSHRSQLDDIVLFPIELSLPKDQFFLFSYSTGGT